MLTNIDVLFNSVIGYALRVVAAIGLLFLGRFLARRARGIVEHLLLQPQVKERLTPTLTRLATQATFYSIIVIAVVLALTLIGVPVVLIAGATTTVLIVVAVALRESLANFAATVIFFIFQPFKTGEIIETMGRTGTVEEIQLFNTILRLFDQRMVSLPNNQIQESGVTNLTRNGVVRADVRVIISYEANLDRVRQIVDEIVSADARVLEAPARDLIFLDLGQDGIQVEVRAFAKSEDFFKLASDLRSLIKTRFEAEGIEIAPARQEIQLIEGKSTDKVTG
jgi:small conductance mechanosensitive channel